MSHLPSTTTPAQSSLLPTQPRHRAVHRPLAGLLLAGLLMAGGAARAADVTVVIDAVQVDDGRVMLALFNHEKHFPGRSLVAQTAQAVGRDAQGRMRFVFADLPPGRYAVSAFHDRNDNQKLDSNLMGLPTEPYGFSNAASGNFGPPKFEQAAFSVGADALTITVTLQ